MSGKKHSVITGYTILDLPSGKLKTRSVKTHVYFRNLSGKEIDKYITTKEPLDRAGAYAIEGRGAWLVKKIEGDFFNVVGLPLAQLIQDLESFGVAVF